MAAFTLCMQLLLLAGLLARVSGNNASMGISWPIISGAALLRHHNSSAFVGRADHQRRGRSLPEVQMTIINAAYYTGKNMRFYVGLGVGNRIAFLSHLLLDINADLTWLQCMPCNRCYDQLDPIFRLTGQDSDLCRKWLAPL
ncbi:hypothetical protein L7F22_038357 [Adiantum nelumboides]|nr:hypothetical protein [Adiantum nelumboides]